MVIEAVRLGANGSRVELARGYERRGSVWSDVLLFTREELLDRLRRGARVAVGRMRALPGDFDIVARVHLRQVDGTDYLASDSASGPGDQVAAPLF